ncbi:MAG: hypothetical protein ACSHYB_05100 [Roseibacillus sp.]
MNFSNLISAAALFLLASVLPSSAQGEPQDEGSSSKRTMRIITFGGQLDSVFYDDGGTKTELFAGPGSFSSEMPIPKDRVLNLYHQNALPEGEEPKESPPQYRQVGSIEIPQGSKVIVLLSVPLDLNKAPIKGRAFKDSYSSHRALTARAFNLTPKEVAVRVDNETISLKPGEEDLISWKPKAYHSVSYQVATRNKDKTTWDQVESGEGVSREDLRTFLFIVEDLYEDVRAVTALAVSDPIPDEAND